MKYYDKNKKHAWIAVVLFCLLLCTISLFVSSRLFVNEEVTVKWMGLMLYYVIRQTVSVCLMHYLLGAVFIFALALSVRCILQYFDLIHTNCNL
jgi:hypothetical protein